MNKKSNQPQINFAEILQNNDEQALINFFKSSNGEAAISNSIFDQWILIEYNEDKVHQFSMLQPLKTAMKLGYTQIVELIIPQSAFFLGPINQFKQTALHLAVYPYQSCEICRLLIKYGAEINALNNKDTTPLLQAIRHQNKQIIQVLLQLGATLKGENSKALHYATITGKVQIVQYLISEGAQINQVNFYEQTPLCLAMNSRNFKIAKILIANGAKIESRFLHLACKQKSITMAKLLIQNGANVNHMKIDSEYYSPIQIAVIYNSYQIAELLIYHGADVNCTLVYCLTLAHQACINGSVRILKLLVQNGAKILNVCKNNWKNVLQCAVMHGQIEITQYLLSLKQIFWIFKIKHDILVQAKKNYLAKNSLKLVLKQMSPIQIIYDRRNNIQDLDIINIAQKFQDLELFEYWRLLQIIISEPQILAKIKKVVQQLNEGSVQFGNNALIQCLDKFQFIDIIHSLKSENVVEYIRSKNFKHIDQKDLLKKPLQYAIENGQIQLIQFLENEGVREDPQNLVTHTQINSYQIEMHLIQNYILQQQS